MNKGRWLRVFKRFEAARSCVLGETLISPISHATDMETWTLTGWASSSWSGSQDTQYFSGDQGCPECSPWPVLSIIGCTYQAAPVGFRGAGTVCTLHTQSLRHTGYLHWLKSSLSGNRGLAFNLGVVEFPEDRHWHPLDYLLLFSISQEIPLND